MSLTNTPLVSLFRFKLCFYVWRCLIIGPTKTTMDDIWRMVWQEKSRTVIMLTNPTETGKVKYYSQFEFLIMRKTFVIFFFLTKFCLNCICRKNVSSIGQNLTRQKITLESKSSLSRLRVIQISQLEHSIYKK